MKKINVNYEKMYYGFPVILISFYDAYEGVTNILGTIKGRLISNEYLNANDRLNFSKFDNLLYFGDGINKGYRYMKN